jgi:hypothetical protein
MNESFDVAAVAQHGRLVPPATEPGGVGTPENRRQAIRVERSAGTAGRRPTPPQFAVGVTQSTPEEALSRLHGPSPDSPAAGVTPTVGDVPFFAGDIEDHGPAPALEGSAGGAARAESAPAPITNRDNP